MSIAVCAAAMRWLRLHSMLATMSSTRRVTAGFASHKAPAHRSVPCLREAEVVIPEPFCGVGSRGALQRRLQRRPVGLDGLLICGHADQLFFLQRRSLSSAAKL